MKTSIFTVILALLAILPMKAYPLFSSTGSRRQERHQIAR